ncbi:unnamed protein product [Cuscuta campestris]|uniref:Uncharacterized protein n=1 Tax=Cuscuta campestris TaxID=132261 RepID=A0A484MBM5_9ASTE|nr:unnamed protein product [Cuscuta campestris]
MRRSRWGWGEGGGIAGGDEESRQMETDDWRGGRRTAGRMMRSRWRERGVPGGGGGSGGRGSRIGPDGDIGKGGRWVGIKVAIAILEIVSSSSAPSPHSESRHLNISTRHLGIGVARRTSVGVIRSLVCDSKSKYLHGIGDDDELH